MCPQTSGAYKTSNRWCRKSRADYQGSREELQGQDQVGAWLAEVHDTARTGLPFRIFHQSRPGIFLLFNRITYLIVSIKFIYIANISSSSLILCFARIVVKKMNKFLFYFKEEEICIIYRKITNLV